MTSKSVGCEFDKFRVGTHLCKLRDIFEVLVTTIATIFPGFSVAESSNVSDLITEVVSLERRLSSAGCPL